MNLYRDVGCSQEDHLPHCSHFAEAGTYLSSHSKECDKQTNGGRKAPCICNPKVRGIIQDTIALKIVEDIQRAWSECNTESADNRRRMEAAFKKAHQALIDKGLSRF